MIRKAVSAFLICLVSTILCTDTVHAEDEYINERCVVSVTVDVSGSMKQTDASRDVPETIKLMMDMCDENDYFSVVAYNDTIVYSSGLISIGDANAVNQLKQSLDDLTYSGYTDNGLGLYKAVSQIDEFKEEYDRAVVVLVSDGETDLGGSKTGRTVKDSNEDIEKSTNLAKGMDIPIFAIEYTDNFTTDTSRISMATSATKGGIFVVNNPEQFVQVMINSFCTGYFDGKTFYTQASAGEEMNRAALESVAGEGERELFFLYSWENIFDAEVLDKGFTVKPETGSRHLILEAQDQNPRSVELIYSLEHKGKLLYGTIKAAKHKKETPEPEVIVQEIEVPVEITSAVPIGSDQQQEVYSSSEKLRIDVSAFFQDDDIVSYQLEDAQSDGRIELTGGILNADISKEGEIKAKIIAKDAAGNTAQSVVTIKITAAWRQYQGLIIGGVIALIVLITGAICFIIIRKILFQKEKTTTAFSGMMIARFIDIKTKNDFDDVKWNLRDYSENGVTLKELFYSKNVKEELKDIEKICFYPGDTRNTIQIVHCIEGGVFIGDHHVKANVPTIVRSGDRIYISIAENASEIELTYMGS